MTFYSFPFNIFNTSFTRSKKTTSLVLHKFRFSAWNGLPDQNTSQQAFKLTKKSFYPVVAALRNPPEVGR